MYTEEQLYTVLWYKGLLILENEHGPTLFHSKLSTNKYVILKEEKKCLDKSGFELIATFKISPNQDHNCAKM